MPSYTDMYGNTYALNDWNNDSHRGRVINNARANRNFRYVPKDGFIQDEYQCFYCKYWYVPAALEGDHVAGQALGRSSDKELKRLFRDAERAENSDGTPWNLVISCQRCNASSRNRDKIYTRSMYKKDRDDERPQGGGAGLGPMFVK
ncbi:hypothetical protein BTA51_14095 [Hahella sp. CCB-MM4]|uniref:HNH endonuclease n=1 Tax=Hahella sp. (strain CCB-MM4) TaxID=1926491 RepID=UPI000B9B1507|nr:HNH endonuclease signature motif containing protein [Hahella sp. CCB-MM4]OZG72657.1 hypothetical protein BTA51_14095 [Hahella sp. CCB-MM4]